MEGAHYNTGFTVTFKFLIAIHVTRNLNSNKQTMRRESIVSKFNSIILNSTWIGFLDESLILKKYLIQGGTKVPPLVPLVQSIQLWLANIVST